MLAELGKGLDRVANVDAIVSDLRHGFFSHCSCNGHTKSLAKRNKLASTPGVSIL